MLPLSNLTHKQFSTLVVVDIEATCWEKTRPEGQKNEIIEIGFCFLDIPTLNVSEKQSILVRPTHSTVSTFCTQLTTLTQEQLERDGILFSTACSHLRNKFNTHKFSWASYGDYDRKMFEKQCQASNIPNPFGHWHLNVKLLTTLCLGLSQQPGMAQALHLLDLPLVGTHHRGDDDAWNIAHITAKLLAGMRNEIEEAQ